MQSKPLSRVRVLEFGGYIACAYATSLLASLGADVVKVERPGTGDEFRRGLNTTSPYWVQYNTGKRSLCVDLKSPDGIELVKALVPRFDVVIENLRPGKMDAMGLGSGDLNKLRPDLVFASVTGFGNGGPLADRPAYDTIGQAFGALNTIFNDAGEPRLLGTCIADLVTGLSSAAGVLAALVGRDASGEAQRMDSSMLEAVSTLTIDAVSQYFDDGHTDPTRQSRHPQAQNFVLKTATGDSMAVHLSSPQKFWQNFVRAMGRADLEDDPRFKTFRDRQDNYFDLAEIAGAEFAKHPLDEWQRRLVEYDVPCAPALTVSGFIEHPQTEWLQLVEPEHNGLSLVGVPWRFGGERPHRAPSAPRIGQDTRTVAAEVYDQDRIDELIASSVLFADE
ncbi:MAG: CoA transferase [Microbacteriaceae bacterium]|nr:MAG: CoA transferase [Microbacteriaceae bacterium]